MSIKVLLADDNITAQRLGSKILSDAGYEVIAVSNGAAAVKKIASEKPDLLILDVYMPGYTGLEVCEKVKQDPAMGSVPVLLTATNMEPFNQADGNRAGADGFMIKPFEASDLLAVVQKFEARMKPSEPPRTQKIATVEEFKDASYEEWKSEAEAEAEASPAKMEIPHDMAAAPALGMEEYAAPAAPAFAVEAAQPMVEEAPAPAFAVESAPAPAFHEPIAEAPVAASPAPLEIPSFGSTEPFPTPFGIEAEQPLEAPALEMPSLGQAAEIAPPAEFEPTSVAPAPDLQIATAAELEPTASGSPELGIAQDPGLVTNPDEIAQFATGFGVANAEEIPVGVAMPEELAPPVEVPAATAVEEETPLYLRTQKIDVYREPEAAPEAAPEPVEAAVPAVEHAAEVESEMQRAFGVGGSGAAAAPALEPEATPETASANPPIPHELVAQFAAELDQAHHERAAMGEAAPVESQLIEASMEAVKDIPASQLDEERIAAAVNRALEKYKDGLRAELIATIVRELKGS